MNDQCATCGRHDAHAEARQHSTSNLPAEHCYHAQPGGNVGSYAAPPMRCCWCGAEMPSTMTVTFVPQAHGMFAPHGAWGRFA